MGRLEKILDKELSKINCEKCKYDCKRKEEDDSDWDWYCEWEDEETKHYERAVNDEIDRRLGK